MSPPLVKDAFEEQPSRYIVGIDLGTTNCAVAYVDTQRRQSSIEHFPVDQWVDFGTSEPRQLLPSFHYQPLSEELESLGLARSATGQSGTSKSKSSSGSKSSKTSTAIVGALARDRGLQLPGRQIASAKSWLSHASVDRQSPILPWQSDEGVEKLSPVEASSQYLRQIRSAWDRRFPKFPLADQDIVLTLPASFDQVARQLTIEAAQQAGLERVLPIEEPQAAFYAWLARHQDSWESRIAPGKSVLVCDIGGGTTDFTLIRVRKSSQAACVREGDGEPGSTIEASSRDVDPDDGQPINALHRQRLALHRVAVGQHLILGGDNIDLALARLAEYKLTGGKALPPRAWDALRQACREAKETLLGGQPPESYTIHLPGSGSKLIGGGNQVTITAEEVQRTVLDGFLPRCRLTARPDTEQVGFQEFGLPFASDAAITKHLAAFLWNHRGDGRDEDELASLSDLQQARPDYILFNGGVMSSDQLSQLLVEVIGSWFAGQEGIDAGWTPEVLQGEKLELAVAYGGAYFGQVRRGEGVEIEAKLACAYYLQTTEDPPQALCIVPGQASPGGRFSLDQWPMELSVGQPVQFQLYYSTTRIADRLGQQVEIDQEQFASLPPIRTVLNLAGRRRQERLPVWIDVELSQIGTLQLWCRSQDADHRWKLEFDVRGSTQTDVQLSEASANQAGILDERTEQVAGEVLQRVFGEQVDLKPAKLMHRLVEALEMPRHEWPPHLLRSIWQQLMDLDPGRGKSPSHEARWLNLLGYSLRPGYGLAADDWRVAETWRRVHGKLRFNAVSSRNESLVLWRRIAGGFTPGQQLTVYQQIAGPLRGELDPARRSKKGGGFSNPTEMIELLRLVGSLELLPKSEKSQLGEWLVELLEVPKWSVGRPAILWTLGRLGARVPSYGPLNAVVDTVRVEGWLRRLLRDPIDDPNYNLALMLCSRKVHDRYRDIDEELRAEVVEQLERSEAGEHSQRLVAEGGKLASEEAQQIVGEALPLGLSLRN